MPRHSATITRLRDARKLLREWRRALHDSHVIKAPDDPRRGEYEPPEMAAEMRRFDLADQVLAETIAAARAGLADARNKRREP